MKSLLLLYPIVCREAGWQRWGWGREVARARWDPIWSDHMSCQVSPQWLGLLSTYQKPSKGACPSAHPKWTASLTVLHLIIDKKETKARSCFGHSNSRLCFHSLTDHTLLIKCMEVSGAAENQTCSLMLCSTVKWKSALLTALVYTETPVGFIDNEQHSPFLQMLKIMWHWPQNGLT